jgi:hypothetical protein
MVGPWVCLVCTGIALNRLNALVGPLIYMRLNGAFRLVDNFCLRSKGAFSLHFVTNTCIALFFEEHVEMTLFLINMHARNTSSPNFLIKLTVEIEP